MLIDLKNNIGEIKTLEAKVVSIKNISGKTFLELSDNTGKIKSFSIKSLQVLPGQTINFSAKVLNNNGNIELEIISVVKPLKFMIESENLEKLENEFKQVAKEIKDAIKNKRQIIIRHHDDTDGYTAGYVIEKAILSILNTDKPHLFYSRKSCRTPFYDYIDALVDLNYYLSAKKYGEQPPLIILTDLGSNNQSINSIKRLKSYGMRFVIIDHHTYDEENKNAVDVFLNTHEKGLGSDICAGALASELAHYINPRGDFTIYPAIAGTADKSVGSDYQKYVKLSGMDKEYLNMWAMVIDHESFYLRFPERTEFLEDLFLLKKEQIEEIYLDIQKESKEIKKSIEKYVQIKQGNGFKFLLIDKTKISDRGYASSKLTAITHGLVEGPRITFVVSHDSMISFRADDVEFSGIDLLQKLKEKFPYALISGGGHDFAGAIKYVEAANSEIMEYIFQYLKL